MSQSSGPRSYRKKPVEIEAMRFDGSPESIAACCEWVNSYPPADMVGGDPTLSYLTDRYNDISYVRDVQIWTLEGPHLVSGGDWIIKGIKGEFYACKPDVFEATYDPV